MFKCYSFHQDRKIMDLYILIVNGEIGKMKRSYTLEMKKKQI